MANPLAQRIANLLARGAVTLVDASKKLQTLQVALLDDEAKDLIEHLEPYGFTSNPPVGAEVLVGFIEGDRSHGVAIVASDRRYREKNLLPGEVALYDQWAHFIKITQTGIIINGNVTITGNVATTGTLQNNGHDVGSTHKHSGVTTGGGQTGTPL
jgi:phage gp45-like